ncbi:MAG: hypothetical protein ACRDVL_01085, partial [Acidimicrobiia bacterium]
MALILFEDDPVISLDTGLMGVLAGIGATSVAVLRDKQTVAVVLEGWAMETERLQETAVVLAGGRPARMLYPVARLTVVPSEGG